MATYTIWGTSGTCALDKHREWAPAYVSAEDQESESSSQAYIQLDDLETSVSNDKLKPLEKPRCKSLK